MADTYRDIIIKDFLLYTVNKPTFRDNYYILLKYPLRIQTKLSATIVSALRSMFDAMSVVCKLSGTMFDKHLGSTIVNWSDIGNADFSIKKTNLAGQAYMNWQGQVYGIKKLGNGVVVYGSGGVTYMPVSDRYFGIKELSTVGCKGRNSYCGNADKHWFISQDGCLVYISGDGKLQRLEGKKLLSIMSDSLVMNYLEEEDEVYVTDGTYGYAISFNGNKYSVRNVEATLTGIDTVKESVYIASPSDFTDSDSTYTTGPYDFGLSGYKTLQSFTVECPFIEQVQGSVYYSDDGITWDWSDWLDLSDNGNVHYTVTAKFFKLSIKVDKSIDTGFINAVSCAVQTPDKRTFTNLAIGGNSGNNTRS